MVGLFGSLLVLLGLPIQMLVELDASNFLQPMVCWPGHSGLTWQEFRIVDVHLLLSYCRVYSYVVV